MINFNIEDFKPYHEIDHYPGRNTYRFKNKKLGDFEYYYLKDQVHVFWGNYFIKKNGAKWIYKHLKHD